MIFSTTNNKEARYRPDKQTNNNNNNNNKIKSKNKTKQTMIHFLKNLSDLEHGMLFIFYSKKEHE